jgi:hypothetical protein
MTQKNSHYIPVLGWRWLTPLYDPLLQWVMREEIFKRKLIEQASVSLIWVVAQAL